MEAWQRALLDEARRATLATIAPDGQPRLVPVCYASRDGGTTLVIALDEKPKSVDDPRDLARVRDIRRDPRVTLLVDAWSEAWSALAWVRLEGVAELIEPGHADHAAAVAALRARYPQYEHQALEGRPLIRVTVERVSGWRAEDPPEG